jgi:predicted anti-sigma-YlaC factor YlaD
LRESDRMPKVHDMDCTEMRRLALGGRLASPEGQRHLDGCAPCRALFADGPELARMFGERRDDVGTIPSFESLEDAIRRDHGWRSRLAELPTSVRWLLATVTLLVPVLVGMLWHRRNLAEYPVARLVAELATLTLVAGAGCWLWLRPLFRRQPHRATSWIIATSAFAVPLALTALPPALPIAAEASDHLIDRAMRCLLFGSMTALPALLILVGVGRRSVGPRGFGLLPATAAALAGIVGLELHCPDASPAHLLVGHASIVWVLPLLLLAARALRRARA